MLFEDLICSSAHRFVKQQICLRTAQHFKLILHFTPIQFPHLFVIDLVPLPKFLYQTPVMSSFRRSSMVDHAFQCVVCVFLR